VKGPRDFVTENTSRLVALAGILVLFLLARIPAVSTAEKRSLGSRFRFTEAPLPEIPGASMRQVRNVHPSLQGISGWISSVGASVSLADLDDDGLPNDLTQVDPRTDQVIVAPVPGTGDRYAPFTLDPSPLPYDPRTMAPMGCLPADLNEDGEVDLLVYYWGRAPVAFLRRCENAQPASPSDAPDVAPAGREGLRADRYRPCEILAGDERLYTNAATSADLDGDGHLDLVLGNYFPDGARILDAQAGGRESMQQSMSRAYNGGTKRFLLLSGSTSGPEPSVSYRDVRLSLPEQIVHGWALAVGTADLDGDCLPEIYFADDFGPDRLFFNRSTPGQLRLTPIEGKRDFRTPSSKIVGRDSFKGMGVEFVDLNADGRLDICVSNIATQYALLESHFAFLAAGDPASMQAGIAPFHDASEELGLSRTGWSWDIRSGDFDNDGIPEILQATGFDQGTTNRWPELQELAMGNDALVSNPRCWPRFQPGDDLSGHQPNAFLVRAGSGRYVDLSREVGLDRPQVSRGIATADVDGDGDLDFAVANQWERSYFYRNDSPGGNGFLGIRLLLPLHRGEPARTQVLEGRPADLALDRPAHRGKGRPAIGASVSIVLPDGSRQTALVDGGNGHSGKRSPEILFGLGKVGPDVILPVEVHFRDPAGEVRRETLRLAPGWHTVVLGWPGEGEERP
jgi:hypothetical protein